MTAIMYRSQVLIICIVDWWFLSAVYALLSAKWTWSGPHVCLAFPDDILSRSVLPIIRGGFGSIASPSFIIAWDRTATTLIWLSHSLSLSVDFWPYVFWTVPLRRWRIFHHQILVKDKIPLSNTLFFKLSTIRNLHLQNALIGFLYLKYMIDLWKPNTQFLKFMNRNWIRL